MSNEKQYDYSEFAGEGHNQPQGEIAELNTLVERQFSLEGEISSLVSKLDDKKKELKQVSEYLLPDKMDEVGLCSYKTKSGLSLELKEKVRGSLPKENATKGYKWLEDNGFGALIESEVHVAYGRKTGELEEAQKLVESLLEKGRPAELERTVHHARLDAFLREQLAQGKDIPLDIFGVYRQRVTVVGKE